MSTPRWLDILLRAREADEDLAARKLADAQRAVVAAAERARFESERAAAMIKPSAPTSVAAFLAAASIAQAGAATASAAFQRVAICEQDVVRERASVLDASRARKVTENLLQRRREAAAAELLRREQAEQDDLASTRGTNTRRSVA